MSAKLHSAASFSSLLMLLPFVGGCDSLSVQPDSEQDISEDPAAYIQADDPREENRLGVTNDLREACYDLFTESGIQSFIEEVELARREGEHRSIALPKLILRCEGFVLQTTCANCMVEIVDQVYSDSAPPPDLIPEEEPPPQTPVEPDPQAAPSPPVSPSPEQPQEPSESVETPPQAPAQLPPPTAEPPDEPEYVFVPGEIFSFLTAADTEYFKSTVFLLNEQIDELVQGQLSAELADLAERGLSGSSLVFSAKCDAAEQAVRLKREGTWVALEETAAVFGIFLSPIEPGWQIEVQEFNCREYPNGVVDIDYELPPGMPSHLEPVCEIDLPC